MLLGEQVSDINRTLIFNMTSNEDLMKFLQQMETKRVEDKRIMEEVRQKERQEDKEELIGIINNVFSDKVKETVAPLIERTEKVESEQQILSEKLNSLVEDMKLVKKRLDTDQQSSVKNDSSA